MYSLFNWCVADVIPGYRDVIKHPIDLTIVGRKLADGEYITGMRYEHGRVNRGFTTKNYASDSKNLMDADETNLDWTPSAEAPYYDANSAAATGLKPVTYLVTCPKPLDSSTLITNKVKANIARNIALTDQDTDKVGTYPIETFSVEPKAAPPEFENEIYKIPAYEIHEPKPIPEPKLIPEPEPTPALIPVQPEIITPDAPVIPLAPIVSVVPPTPLAPLAPPLAPKPSSSDAPKTSDGFPIVAVLISFFGALLAGILIFLFRGRLKHFKAICIILAVATVGMFSIGTVAVFGEDADEWSDLPPEQNFTFTAKGEISLASYDDSEGKDSFEPEVYIDDGQYCGYVYLKGVESSPNYESFERKVDKTKVYSNLDEEEVLYLPSEADFEVTTDEDLDSVKTASLKRAGLKLEVTAKDSSGIPCEWEATAIFRGLEQYQDVHSYNSEAVYEGVLARK
jgi:hypothetical protein